MKKTLYSLMLNDEVVHEVDKLAHKLGTNRSNLVNGILAEYVNLTTPEQRINDIFSALERLVMPSPELVPHFAPNTFTMSLKSSLEYKYRPTVKYEVQLYRGAREAIGELTVIFRTQSAALISAMSDFFRLWKLIEDKHLAPLMSGKTIKYALYDGRFLRSIAAPSRECSADELAEVLSEYIQLLDYSMKGCLTGRLAPADIEARYTDYLKQSPVLI